MNDETPAILTDPLTEPMAPNLALGGALRAARERLDLEVEYVAQQLRMSVHQVRALEDDDLTVLSSPTFVRGFIRNYARLLKIAPEPLIAAYRAMQPEGSSNVSISLQSENIAIVNASRRTLLKYLLASLLVIVGGATWWFYQDWRELKPFFLTVTPQDKPTVEAPTVEPVIQSSSQPSPQTVPAETGAPTVAPNPTSPTDVPASAVAPAGSPLTNSESPVPTSSTGIRMTFSEQTWVSITDSTGKRVFNKIKAADSEDVAEGVPPYNVVVGNAVGVQVFYKGKPFDIYPYTKANVARFTLE